MRLRSIIRSIESQTNVQEKAHLGCVFVQFHHALDVFQIGVVQWLHVGEIVIVHWRVVFKISVGFKLIDFFFCLIINGDGLLFFWLYVDV
jgi:hypothetical protein